jgi:hypothetical protein
MIKAFKTLPVTDVSQQPKALPPQVVGVRKKPCSFCDETRKKVKTALRKLGLAQRS